MAGELDLVVARGRTIVFCEVKARSSDRRGHPFEAVTQAKQCRLRRLALAFLRDQERYWDEVRFDVAALLDDTLEVLEAVF
jgi:putative endonuclease